MAFESLSDKLSEAFKRLRSKGKLKESDVKEAMREVRLALLEADVNYKVAKDFIAAVTEKAIGDEVLESLTPAQQVKMCIRDSLCQEQEHHCDQERHGGGLGHRIAQRRGDGEREREHGHGDCR